MESTNSISKVVVHDVPPYIKVYGDGTVERLVGTEIAAAGVDHHTGVSSKDVVVLPESGVSARLYLPPGAAPGQKLPLVVYFHGGAFIISSTADPKYHEMLNILVKEAKIILVSIDYRNAPEHPLPTAYEDSRAALRWVVKGGDPWIRDYADFGKFFLAGDSAGANISHHLAIKAEFKFEFEFKIAGILMVHPYFWGEEAIGAEAENPFFKAVVDKWWLFVCPSDRGCDDPWINPFVGDAPGLEGLRSRRVLVCVAGNDVLRERGRMYFKSLMESKWEGKAEMYETEGEDHVFHVMDATTRKAYDLIRRCAEFINRED